MDFGEEPRVQAQNVPLSAAGRIPESAPSNPAAPAAPVDEGEQITDEERAILAEQSLRKMMSETVH